MYNYNCPNCGKEVCFKSYEIYDIYKGLPCLDCPQPDIMDIDIRLERIDDGDGDGDSSDPFKEQKEYKYKVQRLTEQKDLSSLEHIEKRSFRGGYHLDHIVPIYYGYINDIPAEKIASLENLQMLPEHKNLEKGISLTDKAKNLLKKWKSA